MTPDNNILVTSQFEAVLVIHHADKICFQYLSNVNSVHHMIYS